MIHVKPITNFEELLNFEQQWNEVFEKSTPEHPFVSFEWISCWWQSYGAGNELCVLVARENDEVVGIAPLMKTQINRRGLPAKAITFIANYHTNRADFILTKNKKEVLAAMIDHLRLHEKDRVVYVLDFMLKGSENEMLLSEILRSRGMHWVKLASISSPYIPIDKTWDDYLKSRTRKFRMKLNGTSNHFMKVGGCEIIQYTAKEIDKAIEELLEISRKTWKYQEGTAIASTQENSSFYRSFAHKAAAKGWLVLWILKVHSQPVAFAYYVVFRKKILALKLGYDEDFSKDSPGDFLSTVSISDAFDNNLIEYDWLGDNNPYKLKWSEQSREHVKYLVFTDTISGYLMYFIEQYVVVFIKKVISLKSVFQPASKKEAGE